MRDREHVELPLEFRPHFLLVLIVLQLKPINSSASHNPIIAHVNLVELASPILVENPHLLLEYEDVLFLLILLQLEHFVVIPEHVLLQVLHFEQVVLHVV
jgi:hypothetical protein